MEEQDLLEEMEKSTSPNPSAVKETHVGPHELLATNTFAEVREARGEGEQVGFNKEVEGFGSDKIPLAVGPNFSEKIVWPLVDVDLI